jgi:predicted dehydrogenase
MRLRGKKAESEENLKVTSKDIDVYEDPFSYFADVIHGKILVKPYDLYAPENNVLVVKILEAAKESANTGKAIHLSAN